MAEFLVASRLILHLITVILLAGYLPTPSTRYRLGPSLIAAALLSTSASLAVQIVTKWDHMVLAEPQPQLVLYVAAVSLPIILARGDMARLYDALKLLRQQNQKAWWPWKKS